MPHGKDVREQHYFSSHPSGVRPSVHHITSYCYKTISYSIYLVIRRGVGGGGGAYSSKIIV